MNDNKYQIKMTSKFKKDLKIAKKFNSKSFPEKRFFFFIPIMNKSQILSNGTELQVCIIF